MIRYRISRRKSKVCKFFTLKCWVKFYTITLTLCPNSVYKNRYFENE